MSKVKVEMECQECQRHFNRTWVKGPRTDVKCPRCNGYDVEVISYFSTVPKPEHLGPRLFVDKKNGVTLKIHTLSTKRWGPYKPPSNS